MATYDPSYNHGYYQSSIEPRYADPDIEDLRRRLLGSEWEGQVEDFFKTHSSHDHPEFPRWTDIAALRDEVVQLRTEVHNMRREMTPPPHPLDKENPALEGLCGSHARGLHENPWSYHRSCPMCWDLLHSD